MDILNGALSGAQRKGLWTVSVSSPYYNNPLDRDFKYFASAKKYVESLSGRKLPQCETADDINAMVLYTGNFRDPKLSNCRIRVFDYND